MREKKSNGDYWVSVIKDWPKNKDDGINNSIKVLITVTIIFQYCKVILNGNNMHAENGTWMK